MRMQCNWPPGWQSSHRCYCCGFHLASLLRPVRYYYEQRNLSLAPSDADSWLFSLPTARVLLSSSHEWRCGVFLTQPFPKRNFYFSRSQGFGHIFLSLFQDLSQVSWTHLLCILITVADRSKYLDRSWLKQRDNVVYALIKSKQQRNSNSYYKIH